jgi:signal transduction histidine kinase
MVKTENEHKVQFQEPISSGVDEGVLILDEQGYITYADEVSARLLGYDTVDLIGFHHEALWAAEQVPYNGMITAESQSYQTALRQRNGRSLPALITITPLTTEGTPHKLISLMRLTDVEQINTALWHTQRLAGIGTLASSVAHELTNPISIITATCSNIQHDINQNALSTTQLSHYIQMIEQSAWRSVRIMEVLRNYTLNNDPQTAVTDLNMILEDALTLVQQQFIKEYNIVIETELEPNLKSIVCDHTRMVQVAINLLTNARDAMYPGGGTITLKSWALPHNNTDPMAQPLYAFSVMDKGKGIPDDLMGRIFQPFFTTKSNHMGTGLGLFISKGIINQHNGRLLAENNPDNGATFTVILPRNLEPPSNESPKDFVV